jgi:hypothetical protein
VDKIGAEADTMMVPVMAVEPCVPAGVRAEQDQFQEHIAGLIALRARPAATFAGLVPAGDLELLANFIMQIGAAAAEASAAPADAA